MAKPLTTVPNIKRRASGTVLPLHTDEEHKKIRAQQVALYEKTKAKRNVAHDPKLFNVKQHKNWLI